YLQNGADVGKSVAVIGSGLTGCETAEDLAGKGHKVTLVEMLKKVGPGVNETVLYDVMSRFNKGDTAILTSHRLMDITDQGVVLLDMKATATTVLPVDTVVLAMGVRPRRNVAQPFIDTFDDVILIGDNVKGGRIAEAISDGFSRAFSF
ncbi:MAG TPA: NADH:flavin oxidoreductase, partial [Ruminococcaceae bacterium]|nr:NADH:flavin oxidoreductase [Oscillospiraceae bacterium]